MTILQGNLSINSVPGDGQTSSKVWLTSVERVGAVARTLQSSNDNLLTVSPLSLALLAKLFCVSRPTVWNSLTNSHRQAELVTTFKHKLKAELFYLAYGEQPTVYSVQSLPQSASDSLST